MSRDWWVWAAILSIGAAACGRDSSEQQPAPIDAGTQLDVPPECDPGARRCDEVLSSFLQICKEDGRWESESCPSGQACDPAAAQCAAKVCTPGTSRCEEGGGAHLVCEANGTAERRDPCGEGQACSDAKTACVPILCAPGETRCSDDHLAVLSCSDDRTSWYADGCPPQEGCVDAVVSCVPVVCTPEQRRCSNDHLSVTVCSADGGQETTETCGLGTGCVDALSACVDVVCIPSSSHCDDPSTAVRCSDDGTAETATHCEPGTVCRASDGSCAVQVCTAGEATCSGDFLTASACAGDGTEWVVAPCADEEACRDGACEPTALVLGQPFVLAPGEEVVVPGGQYAIAVADASLSGPDPIPFPLSLSVSGGAPGSSAPNPSPPPLPPMGPAVAHGWRCGTPLVNRHVPRLAMADAPPMPRPVVLPLAPGDVRTFHLANGEDDPTMNRTAMLLVATDRVRVWEDVTDGLSGAVLPLASAQNIGDVLELQILDRLQALAGPLTDVDGSGGVDIFVTDQITWGAAAYVDGGTIANPDWVPQPYDFGEIVYVQRGQGDPNFSPEWWDDSIPEVLAHELFHLFHIGVSLAYAEDPTYAGWDAYLGEGLAELSASWSGTAAFMGSHYVALQMPEHISIRHLFLDQYVWDEEENIVGYGASALVAEYLMGQAGGVSILGTGAAIEDHGGFAFIGALPTQPAGPDRLTLPDGRDPTAWWHDFATALLLTSLRDDAAPPLTDAPPFALPDRQADPWGGNDGPTLYLDDLGWGYGTGPLLARQPWGQVAGQMKGGGVVFTDTFVSEPEATFTLAPGSAHAALIRYRPAN